MVNIMITIEGIFIKTVLLLGLLILTFSASANDLWTRSYTLEANKQYAEAAATIEPYLQQSPDSEFAQLRSGWLYYLNANYSRSITHYQSALNLNNQSIEARLGLALPLLAQSRWQEAAQQCRDVIKMSNWNYFAHVRLMIAEEGQKQWDKLAKHAEEVNRHYPTDATVLVYLARAYKQLGETARAKKAYNEVLVRIPGHLEASEFMVK